MKNRIFKKLIIFTLLSIFLFAMLFGLSSCKENKWIPSVQGSHVSEVSFEEISEPYIVEKFSNYSSFSKSKWADYYFSQVPAKEERYSKEFFKKSDLITIKFNMPEKGIDYTIMDVSIVENECTVVLLPIKKIRNIKEQPTTYCCFVETAVDVSDLVVELKFEETIVHESISFTYMTSDNECYTFENELEPMVFVINSKDGIPQFIDYDEILTKQTIVYVYLNSFKEEVFETSSLMLVRVLSSVLDDLTIYLDGDILNIVSTYSNHYYVDKDTQFHKLVALLVPKNTNINQISKTVYYEYEDNLEVKSTFNKYSFSAKSSVAQNVIKYSFVEDHD